MEIKETKYGKGLFADQQYNTDDRIGRITGNIYRDDEIPEESKDYVITFTKTKSLDPEPPFRFLNHSCDPNAEIVIEGKELSVYALRDIQVGEQITIDYGWPAFNAIQCGCGSSNCRGWIVAEEELHLVGGNIPD